MFGLGFGEILVILVLVLILFGAGKLPEVMRDLGKGMNAFKDGMGGGETGSRPAKKSALKTVTKRPEVKPVAKKKLTTKAKKR